MISKSYPQVFAVSIWALEIFPLNINSFIIRTFDWTVRRSDTRNPGGIVILITVRLVLRDNLLPVLSIVRNFHNCFRVYISRRSSPGELIIAKIKSKCGISQGLTIRGIVKSNPYWLFDPGAVIVLKLVKTFSVDSNFSFTGRRPCFRTVVCNEQVLVVGECVLNISIMKSLVINKLLAI
jgi:hypothetical protein